MNIQDNARLWQRISLGILVLALLLMAGHALLYVHYAVGLMRFPFDYDQGEGFELVDTVLFSEGKWPYRNTEVYPYYASNYPPLYHVILVPFVWLFGPQYWYGRLVGFLGTVVTASAIGVIVFREGRHRPIAVLSGLAFLASNYIYHVGPLFRQHMLMVTFETLAVLTLAHVMDLDDSRQRRRVMWTGLLLLLAAGYTKQLAIGTCAAVFLFLLLRSPRFSISWGVIFAGMAGVLFLLINVATDGEWWKNIIAANVNTYFPQQFLDLFEQWFRLHHVLVIMAGLFAVYELYFARLSLYSGWWVFAVGMTGLSGKWGAGDSYFATAIAASCVLAGLFAARTLRDEWDFPADHPFVRAVGGLREMLLARRVLLVRAASIVIPLLYMFYGVSVVKMPTKGPIFGPLSETLGLESSYGDRYKFYDAAGWVPGYATIGHVPSQRDIDNGWEIVDILEASDKPAMSEEAGFSLRANRDVITNPTQLKNLYENDLFDETNLVTAIAAHDFSVVVFRAQFYPLPVVDAVYRAYYPAQVIPMNGFNYEIWRPGLPQSERDVFVANLDTLPLWGQNSQPVSLRPAEATAWLDHTLSYLEWDLLPVRPGDWFDRARVFGLTGHNCPARAYHRAGQRVLAQVCPAESASVIVLTRR
ncbi:MAG: hypothetical protein GYB65_05050 [Chloroflexi bacterium]|nr:hypothetical protein [Chloroflexota bacterium]